MFGQFIRKTLLCSDVTDIALFAIFFTGLIAKKIEGVLFVYISAFEISMSIYTQCNLLKLENRIDVTVRKQREFFKMAAVGTILVSNGQKVKEAN